MLSSSFRWSNRSPSQQAHRTGSVLRNAEQVGSQCGLQGRPRRCRTAQGLPGAPVPGGPAKATPALPSCCTSTPLGGPGRGCRWPHPALDSSRAARGSRAGHDRRQEILRNTPWLPHAPTSFHSPARLLPPFHILRTPCQAAVGLRHGSGNLAIACQRNATHQATHLCSRAAWP